MISVVLICIFSVLLICNLCGIDRYNLCVIDRCNLSGINQSNLSGIFSYNPSGIDRYNLNVIVWCNPSVIDRCILSGTGPISEFGVLYSHFYFFFVCPSFWKWNRWNVQDWGKSQGSPDTITNTGWHRPALDGPPTPCHGFGRPFIRRTQWEVLYQSISDSPDLVKYSPHPRMMQLSRSETFNEKVNWKWHPFQLNLLISGRLPQEDEKS